MNANRMGGLDMLRFQAATMVMLFHFAAAPSAPTTVIAKNLDFRWPELAGLYFGWVGVEIFFVISGIVISYSAERASAGKFILARILRLAPAAWLCAPLTAGVLVVFNLIPDADIGRRLIKSLIFYPLGPWIDEVYWTLGIEIVFYALIWLLLAGNQFHRLSQVMAIVGTISAAFWIGGTILAPELLLRTLWDRRFDLSLLHHGVFFALGVSIYLSRSRFQSWLLLLPLVVAGCIEIATKTTAASKDFGVQLSPVVPIIVWLLTTALAYSAMHWQLRSNHWLTMLGLITYPLYLLHDYCGIAIMQTLANHGLNRWTVLIVTVAVVMAISTIVVIAERPIRRWLSVIFTAIDSSSRFIARRAFFHNHE